MRILFILKNAPETAERDGMSRWVFNVVRELTAQGHVVDAVGLVNSPDFRTSLSQYCTKTSFFPAKRHFLTYWRALCGWDYAKIRTHERAVCQCLARIAGGNEYDVIFFCGHGAHVYLPYVRAKRRVLVPLDANNGLVKNVGKDLLSRAKRRVDDILERFSLQSYSEADCVLVVSEADKRLLEATGVSSPIRVVSLGVNFEEFKPSGGKWDAVEKVILFTGVLSFSPNVDAIEYLVREVYEAHGLKAKGIGCVIAGRRPSAALKELCENAGVELLEDLADLRPVFDRAFLYVAPMRIGLGMKTKVIEAMAMGLPVAGTPLAFNGIEHPRGVAVCGNAGEFAKTIVGFASDLERAREMGEQARAFAMDRYNPRAVVEDMLRKVQEVPGANRGNSTRD